MSMAMRQRPMKKTRGIDKFSKIHRGRRIIFFKKNNRGSGRFFKKHRTRHWFLKFIGPVADFLKFIAATVAFFQKNTATSTGY
jgi:hypothetical protein